MTNPLALKEHPHTGLGHTMDPTHALYEQLCELLTDDGHQLAELGDPITGSFAWLKPDEIDRFGLPSSTVAAVYWTNGCNELDNAEWGVQALTPTDAVRILTETMSIAIDHIITTCNATSEQDHPVRHLLAVDASRRNTIDAIRQLGKN